MNKRIILAVAGVATLMFSGCSGGGGSAPTKTEKSVYYADNNFFGVVREDAVKQEDGYVIFDLNGNQVGSIDLDGIITDTNENVLGYCEGSYDSEGYLSGDCTLGVNAYITESETIPKETETNKQADTPSTPVRDTKDINNPWEEPSKDEGEEGDL